MAKESMARFQGASTARVPIRPAVRTSVSRTALPSGPAGKGDKPRPVNGPKFRAGWDKAFAKKKSEETKNKNKS